MFRYSHGAIGALVLLASACSRATTTNPAAVGGGVLRDAAGRDVGSVSVSPADGGGVHLVINAKGLTPGKHGAHVHAVGNCDAATATAFSSAGGHFNPGAKQHGRLNPNGWHAGDLPNLVVDASGAGSMDVVVDSLTVATGANSLFDADGSAVIIHANEDDERTNDGPAGPGNSGARVACAVLARR